MVPTSASGLGHAVAFEGARETEIHHQDAAVLVAHHILRLQVAMNHADSVRRFKRLAYLLDDLDGLFGGKLPAQMDEGAQVFTLDVLHSDELHALGFAQVVDADDVAVRDLRGEDQLLLEALDDCGVSGVFAADRLEGDGAVQLDVPGFVDGAHAAFAEQRDDFVALSEEKARLKNRLAAKDGVT